MLRRTCTYRGGSEEATRKEEEEYVRTEWSRARSCAAAEKSNVSDFDSVSSAVIADYSLSPGTGEKGRSCKRRRQLQVAEEDRNEMADRGCSCRWRSWE